MNPDENSNIFICSYCEQSIKFKKDQEGRRIQCPKCGKSVWVYDNRGTSIFARLTSTWMYERPKLLGLLGSRMVGPVSDTEFLALVARGEIDNDCFVQSPELTKNQEVTAGRLNFSIVKEMCSQREAEEQRVRNLQIREQQRDTKNREILLQGIRKAIADGSLSSNERSQLLAFAAKTGITVAEVEDVLKKESSSLLTQVVEEAVSDGFFDDSENERVSRIAIGLGLSLEFTKDQQFRISLARSAWSIIEQLRTGCLPQTIEFMGAEVFEVVCLKRPAGIHLGGDHYLKLAGKGVIKRVEKSLLLDGQLTAKRYSLSSIIGVQWYSDGLFLKRSSGKSLFIRPVKSGLEWCLFAMHMEAMMTGEPVVGLIPDNSFIPASDIVVAEEAVEELGVDDLVTTDDSPINDWSPSNRIPRFTFRVVGESYGNRDAELKRLSIGEEVYLAREPGNPHDSNAVAVYNQDRRALGYLKREVSVWFAPILDKDRKFQCFVKQRTATGGVVIAVFD
jgi:tellurite resistance protein/DNA-directed RNA polymerase subunit RPC12/RpoP